MDQPTAPFTEKPMKEIRGRCLCGAVEYAVPDELRYAGYCHCPDCRRFSGSCYRSSTPPIRRQTTLAGEVHKSRRSRHD